MTIFRNLLCSYHSMELKSFYDCLNFTSCNNLYSISAKSGFIDLEFLFVVFKISHKILFLDVIYIKYTCRCRYCI